MKPIARILIAVLAATTLAVAASPRSDAAGAPTRFSLTVDGYEIASFSSMRVAQSMAWLDWGNSAHARELQSWALTQKRADLDVVMYNADGKPVARYHLEDAWPSKLEIGALKSDSNEVAVESLTLCHEGFEIR
jgi:hypothetical protein